MYYHDRLRVRFSCDDMVILTESREQRQACGGIVDNSDPISNKPDRGDVSMLP